MPAINPDPLVAENPDPIVNPDPLVSVPSAPSAPPQSLASKAWQFANRPLATLGRDTTPEETAGMGTAAKTAIGVGEAAKHFTESLTSLLSLATLGTGGMLAKAYPMVSRALSGAFGALMAKQTADEVGELVNLPPEQRDAKTVAQKVASIALTGGSAAIAGYDAALKNHPEASPAKAADRANVAPETHKILESSADILPAATAEAAKTVIQEGEKQDALQKQGSGTVDVRQPHEHGETVGEGNAKPIQPTTAQESSGTAPSRPPESQTQTEVPLKPDVPAEVKPPPAISMGGQNPNDPGEISSANLALLGSSLKTLAEQTPRLETRKAFDLGTAMAPLKDGVTDTLQGLRAVGSYLKTKLEGYPAFSTFKGLIGDRHLALSESALNARRFVKDATKALPDKLTREAISNWVDTGGDKARLQEALANTKDRYKLGYERALNLMPDEITIAKNIQNYFHARLRDAQDAGILEEGIENYIHRYYEADTPWKQSILNELRSGIFTGQPALAKQRIFEYDHEAEAAGYKPQKDFVKRVAAYDLALNKAIADRQLVKGMMQMKTASGEPWVSVGGAASKVGGPATEGALLIKPSIKPKNVAEYRAFDHPALRKWKWVAEDAEGKPILVQGSVLIHPDALPQVKALFESSRIRQHPLGRAALNLGSTVKQTMLDLSGFHQVQIGIHAAEHQRMQTRVAKMAEIDLTNPDQRGLVRGGMVIGDTTGRQHFDEGLAGSSLSKHLPFGIGEKIQQYKEWLFGDYIPKIKMTTGLMALERNKELFPNLTPDEVYHLTANQMNAAFGELNYAMMGRSQTMQDALRLVMLSPDFTEARAQFVGQSLTKYGGRPHLDDGKLKIGEQGKALLIGAGALYSLARILNKLTNGEYHFEPENAFNVIHNGKAYSLRTVQGDILKAATEPSQFVRNRLNPIYGRTGMELATGRDYFGRKRDAGQQAKDAVETAIPISARGLFMGREQSLAESLMNSLGVTEHRDSAVQRVSELAEAWKAKNKVYGEPGEFIYDPDKDKFRNITLAARYGDTAAIRSELLKAEQAGIPKDKIVKHYELSAKHLFTGSTKANEEKFKASLTADQRKQYDDAVKERNQISAKIKSVRQ